LRSKAYEKKLNKNLTTGLAAQAELLDQASE
jgi:hypothetical protein